MIPLSVGGMNFYWVHTTRRDKHHTWKWWKYKRADFHQLFGFLISCYEVYGIKASVYRPLRRTSTLEWKVIVGYCNRLTSEIQYAYFKMTTRQTICFWNLAEKVVEPSPTSICWKTYGF
jgi:hypothetical protein